MNPNQTQYGKIATTPEEMSANRASLVAGSGGKLSEVNGQVVPLVKNPSPITVDTLTTNPTTTIVPTPVNNTTAQTNLGVTASGAINTTPPETTTTVPKSDTAITKKTISDRLLGILGIQEGKSDFVAEQQKEQQLAEKNAELTRLNNEALNIQRNFASQIKDLEKNFQGSPQGRQGALTSLYRQRDDALANIRIDQAIAQNNVALAQQTIKTIVDAKYEPLENQLKTLQMYREFLSDDLTEEEAIKLTAQENRYKSNAESIRDTGKAVLEAVVQNGGQSTIPAIQKAMDEENKKLQENPNYTPDVSRIYAAGGQYAGNTLDRQIKEAQLAKLKIETEKINIENKNAGGGTFDTTTEAGQLSSVAQNLASKFDNKFSQQQFLVNVKRLANTGDTKQLADYIFSEAISNIKDTESRKKAMGNYRVVKQLSKLESDLDSYYANGGKTDIFRGTKEDILAKVGTVQNTELRSIGTSIANTLDELARARTGAVINDEEQKLYQSILPGTRKTADLNKAIISGLNGSLTNDIDSILKFQLTGSGFDTISKYLKPEMTVTKEKPIIDTTNNSATVGGQKYSFPTVDALNNFLKDASLL